MRLRLAACCAALVFGAALLAAPNVEDGQVELVATGPGHQQLAKRIAQRSWEITNHLQVEQEKAARLAAEAAERAQEARREAERVRVQAASVSPPQPVQPPPPVGDCGGWRPLFAEHFPAHVVEQACVVSWCESKWSPAAVSATNDHGLFQLNAPSHSERFPEVTGRPWADVYDPTANTIYAAWLYEQSGWGPWTCKKDL